MMSPSTRSVQLFKPRSYAACMKEGFRLTADHPWLLLRATWPFLLLAAVTTWAYYVFYAATAGPNMQLVFPWGWVLYGLLLLLMLAGTLLFTGRVVHLLGLSLQDERLTPLGAFRQWGATGKVALRLLPFVVAEGTAGLLLGAVGTRALLWAAAKQSVTALACTSLAVLAVMLLAMVALLPLGQSALHASLRQGRYVRLAAEGYRHGWRHKGKIFVTNVLAAICYGMVALVVSLPLLIVMLATVQSNLGLAMGDPAGTPPHFAWLASATFVVCTSLLCFCSIFLVASNLFVYGSIETQEREREQNAL